MDQSQPGPIAMGANPASGRLFVDPMMIVRNKVLNKTEPVSRGHV